VLIVEQENGSAGGRDAVEEGQEGLVGWLAETGLEGSEMFRWCVVIGREKYLYNSQLRHTMPTGRLRMAKKESDKKTLKAIDKAVKRAMKNGVTGGLVDQTVATAIHAATVRAAAKETAPKVENAGSPKKVAKLTKKDDGDSP
jgi:hypothetical protein